MNPFVLLGTLLYFCASAWYLYNGQAIMAGMFGAYGVANIFILFLK